MVHHKGKEIKTQFRHKKHPQVTVTLGHIAKDATTSATRDPCRCFGIINIIG